MRQRIKRLRLEQGLSQRELSAPGISYAYIPRVDADARTPSVKALRRIATKLGVTVERMERGEPTPTELGVADDVAVIPVRAARHSAFAFDQTERPRPAGAAPLLPREAERRIGRRWTSPFAQNEHRVRHRGRGRSFGEAAITTAPTTRAPTQGQR